MRVAQVGDYGCIYDADTQEIGTVRLLDTFFGPHVSWVNVPMTDVPPSVLTAFEDHAKIVSDRDEVFSET